MPFPIPCWLLWSSLALLLPGAAVAGARWASRRAAARAAEAEQRAAQGRHSEILGRLAGSVAHDMNNLLGVISNSAYLIERRAEGQPELQAPLAATMRAIDNGRRLTQQLLRVGSRRAAQPVRIELATELPALRDLLAIALGRRHAIEIDVEPGTPAVIADAGELELALVGLALDTRDAPPAADAEDGAEGGRVTLSAGPARPDETVGLPPGPCVALRWRRAGQPAATARVLPVAGAAHRAQGPGVL